MSAMDDGGHEKRSTTTAVPYINVTPLIDVLLVLLIIFMVVTPLKPSRFKADIPKRPKRGSEQAETESAHARCVDLS
jgi:biopolymer transport protein TolR